jgi:hypothetical protein
MLTEAADEDGKANFIYSILLFTSLVHFAFSALLAAVTQVRIMTKP